MATLTSLMLWHKQRTKKNIIRLITQLTEELTPIVLHTKVFSVGAHLQLVRRHN